MASGKGASILPTTNPISSSSSSTPFSSFSSSDPFPPFSTTSSANPSSSTTSSSSSSSPTTASSLLSLARAILMRSFEFLRASLAQQRPWPELMDHTAFSRPDSLADAMHRVRRNLPFYRSNYLAVLAACTALNLLRTPSALLTLLFLLLLWSYLMLIRPGPLSLGGGRSLGEREKLLLLIVFSAFVAFGLSPLGSALISGCVVGSLLILLHASFRAPDDLFLEDPATSSFSTSAGSSNIGSIGGLGGLGFDLGSAAVASGLQSMGAGAGGSGGGGGGSSNSFVSLLIASSSPKGNPPLYSPSKGGFAHSSGASSGSGSSSLRMGGGKGASISSSPSMGSSGKHVGQAGDSALSSAV